MKEENRVLEESYRGIALFTLKSVLINCLYIYIYISDFVGSVFGHKGSLVG